jgi:hypothetical protein
MISYLSKKSIESDLEEKYEKNITVKFKVEGDSLKSNEASVIQPYFIVTLTLFSIYQDEI